MSINLKAKETLIQVGELKGKYRFVLSTELYSKLPESKVIKEAALRSGVSRGVMQACWDAAGEVIKAWSTEGHSVAIPGLGTMRFGVRAKSVATVGEVAGSLITARRVIFTPNVDIKDELQRTPIQITCIDRNGKVVKNVTSGDSGDVEDPDKAAPETAITLAAVHSLEIPREVIPKAEILREVIQRAARPIPAIPALKAVEIL